MERSGDCPIVTQFLSGMGRAFGRFLRCTVASQAGQAPAESRLAGWRSSTSGRVLRCGTAITTEFNQNPTPIVDDASDDRFQLWGQRLDFKQWVQQHVQRGEAMRALAAKHGDMLREVWTRATDGAVQVQLSGSPRSGATGSAGGVVWDTLDAAWHCTYLHELISCETHHASTQYMLLAGHVFPGCGEAWRERWHPPLHPPMCAVLQRLTTRQCEFVRQCACFVWEQRFLANRQGGAMGMPLLKQAVEDLQAAKGAGRNTWLYSGHDYSLLVLLAALRQDRYPPHALDFGAFVQLQLVHTQGRDSVRVSLCCSPFPSAAAGLATRLGPVAPRCLVPDLPLEALQYMTATAKSVPWPLKDRTAAAAAADGGEGAADDL